MKKIIKTIALVATCAMAGTGCVSLGAFFEKLPDSVESLFSQKTLALVGLGYGICAAIKQAQNDGNYKHAACIATASSLPLFGLWLTSGWEEKTDPNQKDDSMLVSAQSLAKPMDHLKTKFNSNSAAAKTLGFMSTGIGFYNFATPIIKFMNNWISSPKTK